MKLDTNDIRTCPAFNLKADYTTVDAVRWCHALAFFSRVMAQGGYCVVVMAGDDGHISVGAVPFDPDTLED